MPPAPAYKNRELRLTPPATQYVRPPSSSSSSMPAAMESTKLSALLVLAMLALSSSPLALAWEKAEPECNSCQSGSPPSTGVPISIPSVPLPPVSVPSVPLPPVSVPSVPLPPVSVPSVPLPTVPIPKLPVPPVTGLPPVSIPTVPIPKLPVPPVTGLPPVTLPPIPIIGGTPKKGHRKACPPPPSPPTPTPTPTPTPSSDKCPIDALKLGACVDVLGNEVHIGDANVKCCPLVKGIAGLSAAACLCTAIKAKVLDISVYVPIALEVLLNCGCAVPPGYKCT